VSLVLVIRERDRFSNTITKRVTKIDASHLDLFDQAHNKKSFPLLTQPVLSITVGAE
jgi:hypothetical protein